MGDPGRPGPPDFLPVTLLALAATTCLAVGVPAADPARCTLDAALGDVRLAACGAGEASWEVTPAAALDTPPDAGETVTFTPEIVANMSVPPEAAALVAATVTIGEDPTVAPGTDTLPIPEGRDTTCTVALTSEPTRHAPPHSEQGYRITALESGLEGDCTAGGPLSSTPRRWCERFPARSPPCGRPTTGNPTASAVPQLGDGKRAAIPYVGFIQCAQP